MPWREERWGGCDGGWCSAAGESRRRPGRGQVRYHLTNPDEQPPAA